MLRVDHVTKSLGGLVAVHDLSFEISNEEIVGIIGPNGAGKTTLVRILTTILRPSSGTAYVGGYDVVKQAPVVRQHIGVVAQDACLDCMLTARDNLDFYAKIHNLPRNVRETKMREVLAWAGLEGKDKDLVDSFSGGMKRKLDLARIMMLTPQFVFLDEPTVGLDPASRRSVWNMINQMKKWGCTVVITTHYMEEADRLCDRLAIIHRGRQVALGAPHEIRAQVGGKSCLQVHASKLTDSMLMPLVRSGVIEKYAITGNYHERVARLYLDEGLRKMPDVVGYLEGQGLSASAVTLQGPTLEDAFIQLTGQLIEE